MACNSSIKFCDDNSIGVMVPCLTSITKGMADYKITLQFVSKDGVALDLTEFKDIYAIIKDARDVPVQTYGTSLTTLTKDVDGKAFFILDATVTLLLLSGNLYAEIQLIDNTDNLTVYKNLHIGVVQISVYQHGHRSEDYTGDQIEVI